MMKLSCIRLMILFVFIVVKSFGYNYNVYANRAEELIVKEEYTRALCCYDTMFQHYKPHAVDLYNASVCAIKLQKWDLAIHYTELLGNKGLDSMFFITNPVYSAIKSRTDWSGFLKITQARHDSIQAVASPIIDSLETLLAIDQLFAKQRLTAYYDIAPPDSFVGEWAKNTLRLMRLFNKYGYLSEDNLGVNVDSANMFDFNGRFPIQVILTHQFQFVKCLDITDSLSHFVLKLMADDIIRPTCWQQLWFMTNYFKQPLSIENMYKIKEGKIYKQILNGHDIQRIEADRAYLGLYSISEQLDRFLFNYKRNDFSIVYTPIDSNQYNSHLNDEYFKNNYQYITTLPK